MFSAIMILSNHYFIILKLFRAIMSYVLYQIKQNNGIKIRLHTTLQLIANSRTTAELKNCKLENPSPLFGSLHCSISRKRQATGFQSLRHIRVKEEGRRKREEENDEDERTRSEIKRKSKRRRKWNSRGITDLKGGGSGR